MAASTCARPSYRPHGSSSSSDSEGRQWVAGGSAGLGQLEASDAPSGLASARCGYRKAAGGGGGSAGRSRSPRASSLSRSRQLAGALTGFPGPTEPQLLQDLRSQDPERWPRESLHLCSSPWCPHATTWLCPRSVAGVWGGLAWPSLGALCSPEGPWGWRSRETLDPSWQGRSCSPLYPHGSPMEGPCRPLQPWTARTPTTGNP